MDGRQQLALAILVGAALVSAPQILQHLDEQADLKREYNQAFATCMGVWESRAVCEESATKWAVTIARQTDAWKVESNIPSRSTKLAAEYAVNICVPKIGHTRSPQFSACTDWLKADVLKDAEACIREDLKRDPVGNMACLDRKTGR